MRTVERGRVVSLKKRTSAVSNKKTSDIRKKIANRTRRAPLTVCERYQSPYVHKAVEHKMIAENAFNCRWNAPPLASTLVSRSENAYNKFV